MHLSRKVEQRTRTNSSLRGSDSSHDKGGVDGSFRKKKPKHQVGFRSNRPKSSKPRHVSPYKSNKYYDRHSSLADGKSSKSNTTLTPDLTEFSQFQPSRTDKEATEISMEFNKNEKKKETKPDSTNVEWKMAETKSKGSIRKFSSPTVKSLNYENFTVSKTVYKNTPSQVITTQNRFVIDDSESEEDEYDNKEDVIDTAIPISDSTNLTKTEETEQEQEPEMTTPLNLLKKATRTKIYSVEMIEGLKLLGMIQVPKLSKEICDKLKTYTDKCSVIHQQYVEYDRRRKPQRKFQNNHHNFVKTDEGRYKNRQYGSKSKGSYQGNGHKFVKSDEGRYKNNFSRNGGKQKRTQSYQSEITADDFAAIRDFKKTTIKRDEDGISKTKSKIRSNLNKLTDKTYSTIEGKIKEEVRYLLDNGANQKDYNELSHFIFEIASTNRFYGKLYSELFGNLIGEFSKSDKEELVEFAEIMKKSMNTTLEEFAEIMTNIRSSDPEKDYDEFCKINKENERRRALSSFMGHLLRIDCINQDVIGKSIYDLILSSRTWIDSVEKTPDQIKESKMCVEEISEVLYAFFESAHAQIIHLNLWDPIFKNICNILKLPRDEKHKGLSPKAKFKFMDIMDMKFMQEYKGIN